MPDLVPVDHDPFADAAPAAQPMFSASDAFRNFADAWQEGMAHYAQQNPDLMSLKNLTQVAPNGRYNWENTPGLEAVTGFGPGGFGMAGSIKAVAPAVAREVAQEAALPMDRIARMGRAQEMGFRTDMPLYHGSGNTFDQFTSVPTTQADMAAPGVSTALDPAVANEFAASRAAQIGGQAQVYPLLHRTVNPAVLDLAGDESHGAVVGALRDAFDAGHDAVMIRNYTTPAGQTKQKVVVVRAANQLRSPQAAFDPRLKFSPNLLAAIGGLSLLPVGAHVLQQVDGDPFDKKGYAAGGRVSGDVAFKDGSPIGLAQNAHGVHFQCHTCKYMDAKAGTCRNPNPKLDGRKVKREWCCNLYDHDGMKVIV